MRISLNRQKRELSRLFCYAEDIGGAHRCRTTVGRRKEIYEESCVTSERTWVLHPLPRAFGVTGSRSRLPIVVVPGLYAFHSPALDCPSCPKCNRELGRLEQDLLVRLVLCTNPQSDASAGLAARAFRSMGLDVAVLPSGEKALREKLRQRIRLNSSRTLKLLRFLEGYRDLVRRTMRLLSGQSPFHGRASPSSAKRSPADANLDTGTEDVLSCLRTPLGWPSSNLRRCRTFRLSRESH